MEDLKADLLIAELLENPSQFFNAGRSYDLLQKYFNGFSLASLSQLLSHKNLTVRKVAIWIVSELGGQAAAVAEDVISLLKEDDRYIKYHSFESLMVLSSSGAKDLFHYVVSSLESNDDVIRKLGMYLISNASDLQLTEALKHYSEIDSHAHIEGLTFLLDTETSSRDRIGGILQGGDEVLIRYAVIFLKRNVKDVDEQNMTSLSQYADNSIKMFLEEFFEE